MSATEFQIMCALANLLGHTTKHTGWMWTHFPAGELRDPVAASRLKAMGLKPGWPDYLFASPQGAINFLELKRKDGGSLLPDQRRVIDALKERGIACEVARGFDHAVEILTTWGVVPTTIKVMA